LFEKSREWRGENQIKPVGSEKDDRKKMGKMTSVGKIHSSLGV
jgi:hypothetical protein